MRKILLAILFLSFFFIVAEHTFASCVYDWAGDVGAALDGCIWSSTTLVTAWDYTVEWGFKYMIQRWTTAIAGVLGLFAVWAIVYGALLMTLSAGEDEKIKKGKDIVKWSILWFIWVVAAGGLISLVVNFIFAVGS